MTTRYTVVIDPGAGTADTYLYAMPANTTMQSVNDVIRSETCEYCIDHQCHTTSKEELNWIMTHLAYLNVDRIVLIRNLPVHHLGAALDRQHYNVEYMKLLQHGQFHVE